MAILMTLSFILHLVTFLAVIILYQRRGVERLNLPTMKEDVHTIHQSMESFLDELEKENEALYRNLVEHIRQKEEQWKKKEEQWEEKLAGLEMHIQSADVQRQNDSEHQVDSPTEQNISPSQEEDTFQKVAQLYQQGFTKEQIAQILRIGNGETELMIHMLPSSRSSK